MFWHAQAFLEYRLEVCHFESLQVTADMIWIPGSQKEPECREENLRRAVEMLGGTLSPKPFYFLCRTFRLGSQDRAPLDKRCLFSKINP